MDQQFDTAIDDVAREMTAAEPPATLRADVFARIAQERAGRRAGLLLPRWTWACAAAVLVLGIATTLWLVRTGPAPSQQASTGAARPASQSATAAPASSTPSIPARISTDVAQEATIAYALAVARSRASGPAADARPVGLPEDAGPAPLAGPDAIDIAPLGPAAIAVPGLGVNALDAIEPLTVSTIGPGSPEPQRRDNE